ncbi:MAG: ADP-ribosyl-[dinitrogen reductase] hydrolase [Magnetococcales bacterium]|nr:ADP-ribosyl-[dinitrogen reductase] hydrolase [Magnetococcales bacterium]
MSSWNDRERRAVGAYLGLAVGDALGATVEFMLPREIQAMYGVHNRIRGGGWLHLRPGQVTDDTEMSLALGEAILAHSGRIDALAIARAFDAWLRGGPIDVGNTVRRGIINFRLHGRTTTDEDEFDAGNGACMRTLPIALATLGWDDASMVAASRAQAHITHNNPLSDAGIECVIRMVQIALHGGGLHAMIAGPLTQLFNAFPKFDYRRARRVENPSAYIVDTLRAVFHAFFLTDSFESCLVEVVNKGGDADTTGAIAGMIAGAHYGVSAIPERWLKALQPEIAKHCRDQSLRLLHGRSEG